MNPSVIAVDPRVVGLDADHPAVLGAVEELRADLAELPGLVVASESGAAKANTKGWQQDLLLDMSGAAAVLTSLAPVLRVWLGRDRRRSLHLTRAAKGKPTVEIDIDGTAISDETIRAAIEQLSD